MTRSITQSRAFRNKAKSTMFKLYEKQRLMSDKVNCSLQEKIAETITLEQRLSSAQLGCFTGQSIRRDLTI